MGETLKRKVYQLIDWYVEMGITTAVGYEPADHYKFVPLPTPGYSPPAKPVSKPVTRTTMSASPREEMPKVPSSPGGAIPRTRLIQEGRELVSKCQTLDELREMVSNFKGCPLKLTATNTVFSDGNPNASIMIIGEAPGADEDREGKPFVGGAGQLLEKAMGAIGLDRTKVYITNMIPWRPPGNRPPTAQEIAQCLPFVERHIELIRPKILVLLGAVATKALLNDSEGIMKIRGQWKDYQTSGLDVSIRAMATYHPAFLMRSPSQKAFLWHDLLTIEDEIRSLKLRV